MKCDLRGIIFIFIAVLTAVISFSTSNASAAALDKVWKVTVGDNVISLGMTKDRVIKVMGAPNSPKNFDLVYTDGKNEIVICFDDKSGLAESIIVRGTSKKYSVDGIKIGDPQTKVKQEWGSPENVKIYGEGRVECWYYPSKNLNFAFSGHKKVISFSVNDFYPEKALEQTTK